MAPQNFIIPRPVFYMLQKAKMHLFGTLRPSNSCFSLKRGAFSHIFMFFILLSKECDFCFKNDLVLGHLDDLKRSTNPPKNLSYVLCRFGNILAFFVGHKRVPRKVCSIMSAGMGVPDKYTPENTNPQFSQSVSQSVVHKQHARLRR